MFFHSVQLHLADIRECQRELQLKSYFGVSRRVGHTSRKVSHTPLFTPPTQQSKAGIAFCILVSLLVDAASGVVFFGSWRSLSPAFCLAFLSSGNWEKQRQYSSDLHRTYAYTPCSDPFSRTLRSGSWTHTFCSLNRSVWIRTMS